MITIRPARVEDYADFARLFVELAVPDPVPSLDKWRDHLVPLALFAEIDGRAVGYCYCEPLTDTGYVRNVVTDPGVRRAGVGRALMDAAMRRFRAAGCTRFCLNVKPDNAPAIALYRSLGMAPEYESTAMQIAWSDVARLTNVTSARAASDPALDEAAERRFGLPRGQLAAARPRRSVVFLQEDGAVVAVAAFDPSFPGAFPFRVARLAYARPLFEAMRALARPQDSAVKLVVEDGRELVTALCAAGAEIRLELAHFAGTLPDDA